ncbi:MAG: TetR/AcrR family transcriptional regulator [Acidimicrobiales bacterium]
MTSESAGPGRPSLKPQRREQILEAAVAVVLEHGISGVTRARIAEQAGIAPPLVHHFIGTQEEVLAATVETIVAHIEQDFIAAAPGDIDPTDALVRSVDVAFGSEIDAPEVNQLVDELVAYSYRSDRVVEQLRALYDGLADELSDLVAKAHPASTPEACSQTAAQIVALAHSAGTFRHLGLTDLATAAHGHARGLAAAGPGER